jgi:hypothetical protein
VADDRDLSGASGSNRPDRPDLFSIPLDNCSILSLAQRFIALRDRAMRLETPP